MEIVLGVLVMGLVAAVGFGSYHWADAKASRQMVRQYRKTDPSGRVLDAIGRTQATDREFMVQVTEALSQSVATTLGLGNNGEDAQPPVSLYAEDEGAQPEHGEDTPRYLPETELIDPWMNPELQEIAARVDGDIN